jgi:hypothetical protein
MLQSGVPAALVAIGPGRWSLCACWEHLHGTLCCFTQRTTAFGSTTSSDPAQPRGERHVCGATMKEKIGQNRSAFLRKSTARYVPNRLCWRTERICVADSDDDGETWSQARPIDLPNSNSGIDAVSLPDRRIVLIFNNSRTQRTPLNLAVSNDGEHFRMFRTLEDQPGEYSYPAIILGRNGTLHVTYTWNRIRIRYASLPILEVPHY